jgi:hypothetical protein
MAQKRRKSSPQHKAKVVTFLGINAGTPGNRVAAWHEDNPEHS